MEFIGIDGCKDGWFCVSLDEDTAYSYRIIQDAESLERYIAHASSVLIDIPIGLLDAGTVERQCDKQGRKLLRPKRASSVFPAPARQTLQAGSFQEAQLINRRVNGRGLSQQSWNIVPKIRQIDDLLHLTQHSRVLFVSVIQSCVSGHLTIEQRCNTIRRRSRENRSDWPC